MISYEVTLQAEPGLATAVEDHMRRQHIPGIFATGCFRSIRFWRASPARFRTSYEASTAADLERYLRDHAATFRAEFQMTFPHGVRVARETWTEVESWGASEIVG
ncbi:MAG TPA: DUF4286 family protein [Gemmatimonadales bacterium]|nr:DUF4286 family protein [Gemmatimonadales bacterium]